MWNIYGKKYDLNDFIDKHPGGKFILERTKGLEDITALFETYHAFSNIEKIQETLHKYEVKENIYNSKQVTEYTNDFTNYRKLVKIVQETYPNRKDIKANLQCVFNNSIIFSIFVYCFYICYFSNYNLFYKSIIQVILATCELSMAFNLLHDASHYGISQYHYINNFFSKITNAFFLWNINGWFYHHVYYHHSYTGLENDPDCIIFNYDNLITQTIGKHNFINIIYIIFPGLYSVQGLSYFFLNYTEEYNHYTKFFPKNKYNKYQPLYDTFDLIIISVKLYFLYSSGLLQTFIHIFTINFLYYINIYPNHSSYETKIENKYNGSDWAKLQICNSGNFLIDNLWWTRIFGAINYQIEHHLFPNMSNIHYPVVSKIVQKYCKENNIPYVNKCTLYEAYSSFNKYLQY